MNFEIVKIALFRAQKNIFLKLKNICILSMYLYFFFNIKAKTSLLILNNGNIMSSNEQIYSI